MKSKKIILGMAMALVLTIESTAAFAANPTSSENVITSLLDATNDYQNMGITTDAKGKLIYKDKVVRYLIAELTINNHGSASYQYLNENGSVDLKVIKENSNVLEVQENSQKEFDDRNIENMKKMLELTTDMEASPFYFHDDPSQITGDGNYASKIINPTDVVTIDERIAQYEKQGITVKYNKAVSANDPLKLMYGAVYYKGKAVKKIVDGEDFMVTLLNAPKDGLSIEATYNSDGMIAGFKEITN